jgi:hypothetical protein
METQLENNKYTVFENLLSTKALSILEKYAQLLPNDKNTTDTWTDMHRLYPDLPNAYTCDVLGKDRLEILNELYNNETLPCYKKTWLRDADIAIHKMPHNTVVPKHTDYCMFSITLFLSKDKSFTGGEFIWWDDNDDVHVVEPAYNKAIIACYDTFKRGASHEVPPIKDGIRYTMQLFVFEKRSETDEDRYAHWEVEKK